MTRSIGFPPTPVVTGPGTGLPVYNIRSYGATGNGTTDDTTAIQKTVNLADGSAPIWVPSGTYRITSALSLPSGTTFEGAGVQAATIRQASSTADVFDLVSAATISDVTISGLTLTGPGSGSGIGIYGTAGANSINRLKLANLVIQSMGSHGLHLLNTILTVCDQVQCYQNGGRGFWWDSGTTLHARNCWANVNAAERGWYLTNMSASKIDSCGSDYNAIGYEFLDCYSMAIEGCDSYNTTAGTSGLDGSSFKVNSCNTLAVRSCFANNNAAVGFYVTGGSYAVELDCIIETAAAGATASIKGDAGNYFMISNPSVQTAWNLVYGCNALFDYSGSSTLLYALESATVQVDSELLLNTGAYTNSAAAAGTSVPTLANSTTGTQINATKDTMLYLTVTTVMVALVIKMGPTASPPANVIVNGIAAQVGTTYALRVPAGWYVAWSATSGAMGTQLAVIC